MIKKIIKLVVGIDERAKKQCNCDTGNNGIFPFPFFLN